MSHFPQAPRGILLLQGALNCTRTAAPSHGWHMHSIVSPNRLAAAHPTPFLVVAALVETDTQSTIGGGLQRVGQCSLL
jgi:hypothetical protein